MKALKYPGFGVGVTATGIMTGDDVDVDVMTPDTDPKSFFALTLKILFAEDFTEAAMTDEDGEEKDEGLPPFFFLDERSVRLCVGITKLSFSCC